MFLCILKLTIYHTEMVSRPGLANEPLIDENSRSLDPYGDHKIMGSFKLTSFPTLIVDFFIKCIGVNLQCSLRAVERVTLIRVLFGMHPY